MDRDLRVDPQAILPPGALEQTLPESARQVFDAVPGPLLLVGSDGCIAAANPPADELFGGALAGMALERLVPDHARSEHETWRRAYQSAPETRQMGRGRELTARALDGREVPVEIGLNPIVVEGRAFVLCVVHDLRERLRDEEARRQVHLQAIEAQRVESLGLLAGGVAHDFNNLLVGILGNASYAASLVDGPELLEVLSDVQEAARSAASLARQLLAYAGRGRIAVVPLDLQELMEGTQPLLRSLVPRTIDLRMTSAGPPIMVRADAEQLRQVLMNLVSNSVAAIERAGGTTGRVRVGLSIHREEAGGAQPDAVVVGHPLEPGPHATLEVQDDGDGIALAALGRIFEPFFSTKQDPGHGMGLAATLGIVRAHKGAIAVTSEVGRGTTFRVMLPVDAPDEDGDEAGASGLVEPAKPKILVIDDEPQVLRFVRRALAGEGMDVVTVDQSEEGIVRFAAEAFDLVLLDLSMPGVHGLEVLHRLRALRADIRVLMMSGYSKREIPKGHGEGPTDFIQKPFTYEELVERVIPCLESGGEG